MLINFIIIFNFQKFNDLAIEFLADAKTELKAFPLDSYLFSLKPSVSFIVALEITTLESRVIMILDKVIKVNLNFSELNFEKKIYSIIKLIF
jgi:hypothetical protein